MTQERRPGLDLSLAVPQPKTQTEAYYEVADPDQKASMINRQIVQVEGVAATVESVRTLATIASAEARQVTQYRPDAVAALNGQNLVAIANSLVQETEEDRYTRVVESGVAQIFQAEERAQGVKLDLGDPTVAEFRQEIFLELAERLNQIGPTDFEGHREAITAIDNMITPALLKEIQRNHPDVFLALVRNTPSFSNDAIRQALERHFDE